MVDNVKTKIPRQNLKHLLLILVTFCNFKTSGKYIVDNVKTKI